MQCDGKVAGHKAEQPAGIYQKSKQGQRKIQHIAVGLEFGGPVTMIYGWPIAGGFTLVVGLAMAEICSAYPTSGGLYFWSARLCGDQWGPFASWITGW